MAIIKTQQDTIYNEAELCIMAQLLITIQKKQWLSNQPTVTLSTASKGLSPSVVPELTKDPVGKSE
eukprot:11936629-Ditylum_brightwellii.AAC.1